MRRIKLVAVALSFCFCAYSQIDHSRLLEGLTEILMEGSEEANIEEVLETWEYFIENPININSDCADKLRSLMIFSEFQIKNLLDYKRRNGQVLSIYELMSVEGFHQEFLQKVEPFLFFNFSENKEKINRRLRNELIVRTFRVVEKSEGYKSENGFLGSPLKYYMRFRQSGGHFNFGFTMEKDPGEPFFKAPNKGGFDFYSVFADYETKNKKGHFYLGDYFIRVGQGLAVWQGFSSGKSVAVDQVCRFNQGIRPYSSADENRFFRGIAFSLKYKHGDLLMFFSRKEVDANIEERNGELGFSSFQKTGLHRTNSEITDKHSITENVAGMSFSFKKNNFSFGLNGIHAFFNHQKLPGEHVYQMYLFSGRQITNFSVDYKWSLKKMFLYGETAYNIGNGFASVSGILLSPADQLELTLHYRNFGKNYNSIFGQAFSEGTTINDEHGFYVGMKLLPIAKMTVTAYYDVYSSRWLKYGTVAPSLGTETFIQLNYFILPKADFYIRYSFSKDESKFQNGQLNYNEMNHLQRIRLNFDVNVNEQWSLKSRVEFSLFKIMEKEKGMLLLQDLKYKSNRFPLSFQLRFAWFDTESYQCRLYTYENDMLYNFSVPALAGKGIRTYLNSKYSLSEKLDLWMKVGRMQYFESDVIGTGLNEILGDRKTEVKFQIRYRF